MGYGAQGIGLDSVLHGWIDRLLRRDASRRSRCPAPTRSAAWSSPRDDALEADVSLRNNLYGHSAGVATRLFAFLVDLVHDPVAVHRGRPRRHLRAVDRAGQRRAPLRGTPRLVPRSAALGIHVLRVSCSLRTAAHSAWPCSVSESFALDGGDDRHSPRSGTGAGIPAELLVFCIGFVLIVLRRDRRALHDVIARTAVIYSWEARSANLGFLTKRRTPETDTP